MKLGFENLQTTAGALNAPVVSIAEALQAGLEAFDMIDSFDGEAVALEGMISGLENLEMVQASVEANGVEASLIAMVGTEVATIAPAILGVKVIDGEGNETEEVKVDVDAVKSELSVAQEGFAAKVIDAIKAMIAKIVAFVKSFFDKAGKLRDANATLENAIDVSKVDADKLKDMKVTGIQEALFSKALAGHAKADEVVKSFIAMLGTSGITEEAIIAKAKELDAKLGLPEGFKGEKRTISQLGFDAKRIVGHAGTARQLIDLGKTLPAIVEGSKGQIEKSLGKDASKEDQKAATTAIKAMNKLVSNVTKQIVKLSVQEVSMLKACKSAMSKEAAKPTEGDDK